MDKEHKTQKKIRDVIEKKRRQIEFWEKIEKLPMNIVSFMDNKFIQISNYEWAITNFGITRTETYFSQEKEDVSEYYSIDFGGLSAESIYEYLLLAEKLSEMQKIHCNDSIRLKIIEFIENHLNVLNNIRDDMGEKNMDSKETGISLLEFYDWFYSASFCNKGLELCIGVGFSVEQNEINPTTDNPPSIGFATINLTFNEEDNEIKIDKIREIEINHT